MENQEINKALQVLNQGNLLLFPDETGWVIGCDACHAKAVERLLNLGAGIGAKSAVLLLGNINLLDRYFTEIPDVAFDLIELSDKPLTLYLEGARNMAPALTRADISVGIRLAREQLSNQLVGRFRKPVVTVPVPRGSKHRAASLEEIDQTLIASVDYVVDIQPAPFEKSSFIKLGPGGEIEIC